MVGLVVWSLMYYYTPSGTCTQHLTNYTNINFSHLNGMAHLAQILGCLLTCKITRKLVKNDHNYHITWLCVISAPTLSSVDRKMQSTIFKTPPPSTHPHTHSLNKSITKLANHWFPSFFGNVKKFHIKVGSGLRLNSHVYYTQKQFLTLICPH